MRCPKLGKLVELPLSIEEIERLRAAGFAVVPIKPTDDMLSVGAPCCFSAYDGDIVRAKKDAEECWLCMLEIGCL